MSDLSVLKYARFHGLTIDHTTEDVLATLSDLDFSLDFHDNDASLPEFDFSAFAHDVKEPKLQLSRRGTLLLAESVKAPCSTVHWENVLPPRHRVRNLKIEEPILAGDHRTHVANFHREAKASLNPKRFLEQCVRTTITTGEDFQDEWDDILSGRSWKGVEERLAKDKIQISKEALACLRNCSKDTLRSSEIDEILAESVQVKPALPPQPLTPLMMPEESSSPPRVPSPELGLSPGPGDEIDWDSLLSHVENELEDRDQIFQDTVNHLDSVQTEQSPEEAMSVADLDIGEYAQDLMSNPFDMDLDVKPFESAQEPSGVAECKQERERSSLPDGEFKLPVPCVRAASLPFPDPTQRIDTLSYLPDDLLFEPPTLIEDEAKFSRPTFASCLSRVKLDEEISGSDIVSQAIKPPLAVMRSEKMLWKQPGLRILDAEEDSDDEIDKDKDLEIVLSTPVEFRIPHKRLCSDLEYASKRSIPVSATPLQSGLCALELPKATPTTKPATFSASTALEAFLDLRGSKFKKNDQPCRLVADATLDDPIQDTQCDRKLDFSPAKPLSQDLNETVGESERFEIVQVPSTPLNAAREVDGKAVESIRTLDRPKSIVIDTQVLTNHRLLVISLEKQGGHRLTIVCRDMTSTKRREELIESASPDIILNPTTGVIFTNLQALGQKNLPGQSGFGKQGTIQTKMISLARTYDRLFVLVAIPSSGGQILQNTQETITAFSAHCSSIGVQGVPKVNPIWVPVGIESPPTEPAFHSWTWDLVCDYGLAMSEPCQGTDSFPENTPSFVDETPWELWLRRIGLNPMAAQVVLRLLRKPESADVQVNSSWGLRKLVEMQSAERIQTFADILGLRAIERLNVALDAQSV